MKGGEIMDGKKHNRGIHMVTFILLSVGGLNWLLLGLFQWEIGSLFGGPSAMISRVIYILVGLSAVYELATHKNNCKACNDKGSIAPAAPATPKTPMNGSV